jgi:protein tyrosine/serine phosphatase
MRFFGVIKLSILFLACLLALNEFAAHARGLPPSDGITNFGKVDTTLYRGAQPDETGIKHLKVLGVTTIINLRMPGDVAKAEASEAGANGITYTNLPLAGLGRPTDAEVSKILSLIRNSPGPVFIHCEHGCDRTGTIAACYRIQYDGWSYADAMKEANKYGLSIWERGMRRYIADFAKAAHPPVVKTATARP